MEKNEIRWAKLGASEGEVPLWNSAEASADEKTHSSMTYINVGYGLQKKNLIMHSSVKPGTGKTCW